MVIAKISEETHEDLQVIQTAIIDYGIKTLPKPLHTIAESFRDKPATYKTIIAISVKFVRKIIEDIELKKQI